MTLSSLIEELKKAIIEGDEVAAARLAVKAINSGVSPSDLIKEAINDPMVKVGKDFQNGDIYLPELIMIGDAARSASDIIIPHIPIDDQDAKKGGTIVIGTIQGDMHDIGKNIVSAFLTASGFKVKDLGTSVSPKEFINAVRENNAVAIAISTLLSTTLPLFADIIHLLIDSGLRDRVFVMVGGGPVTPEWAADIGADGYGRDAADAVDLARQLLLNDLSPRLSKPVVIGALKN
jgi:methylmalonyl-CoA mutase cobalamin-binding domain/chain